MLITKWENKMERRNFNSSLFSLLTEVPTAATTIGIPTVIFTNAYKSLYRVYQSIPDL